MKNLLCCSRNNGSNIHINMYANFGNLELKLTQVNTIKYDVKSYQFMTTMVKCTDVRLKIFKELTTYRRYVDTVNECVMQLPHFKYNAIGLKQEVFRFVRM